MQQYRDNLVIPANSGTVISNQLPTTRVETLASVLQEALEQLRGNDVLLSDFLTKLVGGPPTSAPPGVKPEALPSGALENLDNKAVKLRDGLRDQAVVLQRLAAIA